MHSIMICLWPVGDKVDVATLCQIITKCMRELKTTADELKDAFQIFDKQGTGMISVHDLKHSLTTLGEALTPAEMDELIREVDQDGEGLVNYEGRWCITDHIRICLGNIFKQQPYFELFYNYRHIFTITSTHYISKIRNFF